VFDMPPGNALILPSAHDEAFVYIVSSADTRSYFVLRSDGSFQRELSLPSGVDVSHLFDKFRLFFDPHGELVISADGDGNMVAHDTRTQRDTPLGKLDPYISFDSRGEALLSCGDKGLVRAPLDGAAKLTLDTVCSPDILRVVDGQVLYKRGKAIYRVPERGGVPEVAIAPPEDREVGQLLLAAGGALVYSLDPPLTYGAGIGDGYLRGEKYLQRGRRPSLTDGGARLRWLENAARSDSTGELMSAPVPKSDATPLLLARNVRQYAEVAPGKVLCVANANGKGAYNRIILVDERAMTARYVVDSARSFLRIPGTNDVLVQIVNGQIGYDIRRVPIPL
jgi:hypothetical protein